MKVDVPFIPQEGGFDCGPTMLRIANEWADKDVSYGKVKELLEWEPGNAIATAQLCLVADTLGFEATLHTAESEFEDNMYEEEEYYQEHGDMEGAKKAFRELERRDDLYEDHVLTTEEIKNRLEAELVIALLNWEETRSGDGYTGHFVIITGVENQTVYVHQVGADPQPDMPLDRSVFEAARHDDRTDQDTLCLKP